MAKTRESLVIARGIITLHSQDQIALERIIIWGVPNFEDKEVNVTLNDTCTALRSLALPAKASVVQ